MNLANLKMALDAASAIRDRVKDYNEQKAREAYDLLSEAASRVDIDDLKARGEALLDEGRREAGQVTQAAHARLDAAKKRLEEAAENRPAALRSPKAVRAAARKAKRRRAWSLAGLAALLVSVIAGGVYWFTRQKPEPGDTPPRVEDFASADERAEESTLVYSTQTPAEGVPEERDDELLGSLDEQLEKHRLATEDEAGEFEIVEDLDTGSVDDVTDPDAESGDKK